MTPRRIFWKFEQRTSLTFRLSFSQRYFTFVVVFRLGARHLFGIFVDGKQNPVITQRFAFIWFCFDLVGPNYLLYLTLIYPLLLWKFPNNLTKENMLNQVWIVILRTLQLVRERKHNSLNYMVIYRWLHLHTFPSLRIGLFMYTFLEQNEKCRVHVYKLSLGGVVEQQHWYRSTGAM